MSYVRHLTEVMTIYWGRHLTHTMLCNPLIKLGRWGVIIPILLMGKLSHEEGKKFPQDDTAEIFFLIFIFEVR